MATATQVAQPEKKERPSYEAIKRYMRATVMEGICVDDGEVNSTRLAEDAADHFNDFVNADFDIDERYFEAAFEIFEWYFRSVQAGRIK